jgi:hypothetical protein
MDYCCCKTYASSSDASATQRKPTVPARSYPPSNKRYLLAWVTKGGARFRWFLIGKYVQSSKTFQKFFPDALVVAAQLDAVPEVPAAASGPVVAAAHQKLTARVPVAVRVGKLIGTAVSVRHQHRAAAAVRCTCQMLPTMSLMPHTLLPLGCAARAKSKRKSGCNYADHNQHPAPRTPTAPYTPSTRSGGGGSVSEFCAGV